jgi:ubiquinone/menaquinone biosynthesis C-methylase UbiE
MESVRNPGPPPSPSREAWSRYWQAGALHSCGGAFGGNYEGATASFWRGQFERVPDGGRVVDLGTGNGAIPLLARQAATELGRRFDIHGVDAAAIDPAAALADGARAFAGIRFHAGTSATQLPFPDASVALACGQYALEYMPREAAVAEVARVIGRAGRAAFVLHSRDSALLETTAEQLAHCRLLFEDSVVFGRARLMGEVLAAATTPEQRRALADDPRAQSLRHELNEAAGMVVDRVETARTPALLQTALGAISATLQAAAQLGPEGVAEHLHRHERALRDEWDRLCDLDEAALDPAQAEALRARFVAAGYGATVLGHLDHAPGQRLGWTLVAEA